MSARVLIIADNYHVARDWCKENGHDPRAVSIITPGSAFRLNGYYGCDDLEVHRVVDPSRHQVRTIVEIGEMERQARSRGLL